MNKYMKTSVHISVALCIAAMAFASCAPEPVAQGVSEPFPNAITIRQLKALAAPINQNNPGMTDFFSIKEVTKACSIEGFVVSDDRAGNVYKYLTVRDDRGDCIRVSIDAGSISGLYPKGQRVSIDCKGLTLGRYGEMLQMGIWVYNDDAGKGYKQTSGMPKSMADTRVRAVGGLPELKKAQPVSMKISDIVAKRTGIEIDEVCSKYVKLENIEFAPVNEEGFPTFSNDTGGIGYPVAVKIYHKNDPTQLDTIFIATSEYARFADTELPKGSGSVNAIVGWYKNSNSRPGAWQLTLCSLTDLQGFNGQYK